ncbi:hypothetical protein MBLNU230_g6409t1 [Neophaeotheca triangularis]
MRLARLPWRRAPFRSPLDATRLSKGSRIRSFSAIPALRQAGPPRGIPGHEEQGHTGGGPRLPESIFGRLALGLVGVVGVWVGLGSIGYGGEGYEKLRQKFWPRASPDGFYRYTLVGKENVSSTSAILTLKGRGIDTSAPELERAVVSVLFKQPQLQIARAYTLLPSTEESQANGELRFLVRKEQNGEMSGYLHRLPLNAEVEIRGPSVDYVLPESVSELLFLAGGTGIVPAMQVLKAVDSDTPVHISWANRRREECIGGNSDSSEFSFSSLLQYIGVSTTSSDAAPPVDGNASALIQQLDNMKRPRNAGSSDKRKTTIDYFVDEEGSLISSKTVQKVIKDSDRNIDTHSGSKLIFVCGPEGFVNHWAGPKQWVDGREVQGPLRGVLSTLDTKGWSVFKL